MGGLHLYSWPDPKNDRGSRIKASIPTLRALLNQLISEHHRCAFTCHPQRHRKHTPQNVRSRTRGVPVFCSRHFLNLVHLCWIKEENSLRMTKKSNKANLCLSKAFFPPSKNSTNSKYIPRNLIEVSMKLIKPPNAWPATHISTQPTRWNLFLTGITGTDSSERSPPLSTMSMGTAHVLLIDPPQKAFERIMGLFQDPMLGKRPSKQATFQ